MKMIIRYHRLIIGFTPIILDANNTVNGFVMALEKPNPHATMQMRKPVNESYPMDTASITMIGNNVNISSNRPNNAPNSMKIRDIMLIKLAPIIS